MNLAIFGDSNAYRIAEGKNFSFPIPAFCAGVPGKTTHQMYFDMFAGMLAKYPSHVLIWGGHNDIAHGYDSYGSLPPANTPALNIWRCASDIAAVAKPILVKIHHIACVESGWQYATVVAFNAAVDEWNAHVTDYAATYAWPLIDLCAPFLNVDGTPNTNLLRADDLFHLREPEGNEIAAKAIRQVVLSLL